MIKSSGKGRLRGEGFTLARRSTLESIISEEVWGQQLEAANHSTSTARKKGEVNACHCLPNPFSTRFGVSVKEWCFLQWAGLLISIDYGN